MAEVFGIQFYESANPESTSLPLTVILNLPALLAPMQIGDEDQGFRICSGTELFFVQYRFRNKFGMTISPDSE